MEPRESHWPFSALYGSITGLMEPAYADITRRIALSPETREILEIGGGDGRLAVTLANQYPFLSRIVTTDVSHDMVLRASQRAKLKRREHRIVTEVGNVHGLRYGDNHFDATVFFVSLHHRRDPIRGLREAFRILKSGGTL